MNVFKQAQAQGLVTYIAKSDQVADLTQRCRLTPKEAGDVLQATDSWELMQAGTTGASVTEMAARLDAYDAAVAREQWRARVMSDAGETYAGMVVAVGACLLSIVFMAAFGAMVGVTP